jgi:hypothetical protein
MWAEIFQVMICLNSYDVHLSALNIAHLRVSLDIPASAAKIAVPPDGCKMTDKLGISSAPSQVTLLANHLR